MITNFLKRVIVTILPVAFGVNLAAADMRSFCSDVHTDVLVGAPTVKILSLNIAHGRGKAINQLLVTRKKTYRNLDRIADLLSGVDADFVALQEADAPSRWSGRFDHVAYLRSRANYRCSLHGVHETGWMAQFGTAILSSVRTDDERTVGFEPSPPSTTKGLVAATIPWVIDGSTVPVTVVSVHLDFLRKKVRDAQVDAIVADLADLDTPLIVAGDFNSEWTGDESTVRALAQGLELTAYRPQLDEPGTFRSMSGKRFDWILISRQLRFIQHEVLSGAVSDHLAVYAEIGYRGE